MGQVREFFFKDYRVIPAPERQFRLDTTEWVELPYAYVYPGLTNHLRKLYEPGPVPKDAPHIVRLLRKIEILEDGQWKPYPSTFWVDDDEEALYTVAIFANFDGQGFHIAQSTNGLPDGKLMMAAEKAGIYIETLG